MESINSKARYQKDSSTSLLYLLVCVKVQNSHPTVESTAGEYVHENSKITVVFTHQTIFSNAKFKYY